MSCLNITCSGRGECVENPFPLCLCASRFDSKTDCETNYFEVWGDAIIYYIVHGYLWTIVLGGLFAYETLADCMKCSKSARGKLTILPKISALTMIVCRFIHYTLFNVYMIYDNDGEVIQFEEVAYIAGLTAGLATYTFIILLWIDLITGVKNLVVGEALTKGFKHSSMFFIVLVATFIPFSILTHYFGTVGKNARIAVTIHGIITTFFLAVHVVWSIVVVYKINNVLKCMLPKIWKSRKYLFNLLIAFTGKFTRFRYRNKLLSITTVAVSMLAISVAVYSIFRIGETPWGYYGKLLLYCTRREDVVVR
eukprot:TRINITY_DN4911_c0_g1_i2.p1 TRINITY_DN4911_c0_g1~~TRINITY_DN4911_c0_g1_i2.p1  ORF type:complete len:309 (-),score=-6.13 TRINITY_DN4911_c0_g1_i2:310-1236(-)